MLNTKEVAQSLRKNGYKVTPQRLAVYEWLSHTQEHPTAEMLYSRLQPKYPSMSLSTVYKAMDIFEKLQLVKVLNTGEVSYRFDADTSEHAHVQCLECGRVDDVRIDPAEIREQAGRDSGYEVQKQEVYFYGVCPRCRSKKEAGAAGDKN